MTDALQALAAQLAAHGVREAFGVTGSGASLQLICALEQHGVTYYPVAHEAAAALMAGSVFWDTGRLAAAISIKGPGFANMLPGIVCNHLDSRASVTIAEAYGDEVPSFKRHKRVNQMAIGRSLLKTWTTLDRLADTLPALLASAVEEVPGPVHVELCHAAAAGDVRTSEGVLAGSSVSLPSVLMRSRRPVVIAGSIARRRAWGTALESLPCPVFTTASGKGAVDERMPNAAGVYTGDGRELAGESAIIPEADCIVGLGLRNIEVVNPRAFGDRGVLADEISGYADGFGATTIAHPDAIELVMDRLKTIDAWGADLVEASRTQLADRIAQQAWTPARCIDVLNRQPLDYSLVVDTGSFCTVAEQCWVATPHRAFIGSGNARFMGVGLPMAIGAALAARSRAFVCVVGDGGIRPYLPELMLAVEESLPLCVILMSDGAYGSVIASAPAAVRTSGAMRIARSSWWRAVEGMGIDACRVDSMVGFEAALASWTRDRPVFVEAVFDPAEYAVIPGLLRA